MHGIIHRHAHASVVFSCEGFFFLEEEEEEEILQLGQHAVECESSP